MILTGDFHLATQMVGADTADFYPAMTDEAAGSRDRRRTGRAPRDGSHADFAVSVGLVNGKRCLGGMLELMMHCHYLVAVDGAELGMPEVTLPVVPGMEGCHWPFRRTARKHWPRLLAMLLEGRPVEAAGTVGWLVDFAGGLDDALQIAYTVASGGDHGLASAASRRVRSRMWSGRCRSSPRPRPGDGGGPEGDPGHHPCRHLRHPGRGAGDPGQSFRWLHGQRGLPPRRHRLRLEEDGDGVRRVLSSEL